MDKKTAIQLLGGTTASAARAIGVTPQAITNWDDELTSLMCDRVHAALYRIEKGIPHPPLKSTLKEPA